MQGYENPNVVKDVYLPLEYDFITGSPIMTFREFAQAYKERTGIDLHDIFELNKNGNLFQINYKTFLKLFVVGTGGLHNYHNLVLPNIPPAISATVQDETEKILFQIILGVAGDYGYGFSITLPKLEDGVVNTIDDLKVEAFEL